MAIVRGSDLYGLHYDDVQVVNKEVDSTYLTSLQATQTSRFKLLVETLDMLEDMYAGTDVVRLEGDILKQLERLGALRYFHACLSSTVQSVPAKLVEEPGVNDSVTGHSSKLVFSTGRKELRKLRRKRVSENENDSSMQEFGLETISNNIKPPKLIRQSRSRNKRLKVAKNEAELSSSVKLVAELEKIRLILEAETNEVATLSSWAEATGLEKKELLHHLHYGWHCMDELVRSTRSLVLYIARNYRGLGVSFDDLIQAGNLGVLLGAERFDESRGYKFSTYVQYWIRKSISTLIARHARGIRIPCSLSKGINHIQKARKYLSISNGNHPDDQEIAKFTGLSLAKIKSASECLRVVGSIDQKFGDGISIKYMEVTVDTSIANPEEAVTRQHMVKDLYTLLNGLEPREIQVLMLRFGLKNSQQKSLEEIGVLFGVSKEWIRKIEKGALTKLRNEDCHKILSHYARMQ
ncbi:RNA polymerase sigma factor sigC-like [Dorcoceras hygrometricum]|uniref:RNA polymerase sigma factor sigC-like n=1 Tax=Dorcoceras hygrometricum TaxID=472368 RepID=A0A2Z7CC37_9LAMI|nr:RNA polymerase sigma factor sigC-like [Dorcoceras hygrometricum]